MPCSVQGVSGSASHVPLTGTSLALSILIITGRCNPSVAASHQVDNRSAGQKGDWLLIPSDFPLATRSRLRKEPREILIIEKISMTQKIAGRGRKFPSHNHKVCQLGAVVLPGPLNRTLCGPPGCRVGPKRSSLRLRATFLGHCWPGAWAAGAIDAKPRARWSRSRAATGNAFLTTVQEITQIDNQYFDNQRRTACGRLIITPRVLAVQ